MYQCCFFTRRLYGVKKNWKSNKVITYNRHNSGIQSCGLLVKGFKPRMPTSDPVKHFVGYAGGLEASFISNLGIVSLIYLTYIFKSFPSALTPNKFRTAGSQKNSIFTS